ncbi:MAG: signal peptidase I [Cocleimonas sp.]
MEKGFNIELLLVGATLLSGLIILLYSLLRRGKPKQIRGDEPFLVDFAKSFFPILLLVLIIRSFVAEPFRIPSGSMIPTLEVGDFILVKKYAYGVRLPVLHTKILEIAKPKRGDVVVFRYPPQPEINYIKRLIGLPGDTIEWSNDKTLTINGKAVTYKPTDDYSVKDSRGKSHQVIQNIETLSNNLSHRLIVFPQSTRAGKWDVPQGHYFLMGDNRDNSSDSRFWGFVPEENLVGKASLVWMHWNWQENGDGFQAHRIGSPVN